MNIDLRQLNTSIDQFLETDRGRELIDEFENSVLFNVIGSLIMVPIALLLICTIFLARYGIEILWGMGKAVLNGDMFRDGRKKLRENHDSLKPLILGTIIIGPSGHGLVIGSFSSDAQQSTDVLANKANEFAELYAEEFPAPEDEEMSDLLKDDTYIPNRRRKVPASHSEGLDLTLFDMEIDLDKAYLSRDQAGWVAALAELDSDQDPTILRGSINQIPWDVISSCIID